MYQCLEMLVGIRGIENRSRWIGVCLTLNWWEKCCKHFTHWIRRHFSWLYGCNKNAQWRIETNQRAQALFHWNGSHHHLIILRWTWHWVSFGIVIIDSNGAVMVACRDQLPLWVINYRWQPTYHWKPWTSVKILELWTWLMVIKFTNSSLHCLTQRNLAYWRFQIWWNLFDLFVALINTLA